MSEFAIKLENISKSFQLGKPKGLFSKIKNFKNKIKNEKFFALDNISFQVPKGQIIAIIGTNGSGKTTLLRIIAGIYQPDNGKVEVNGDLAPLLHIGTGFENELAARDNIIMYGLLLGMSKSQIKAKVDKIIEFAELQKFASLKLKHYSSGMKVRLAFSTALQTNPDIILMDEALAVGDKPFKEKSFEEFQSFKEKGKTIIFTTHSLGQYKEFCDQALLLHRGKILLISGPDEVIEKYNQITKKKPNKPKKNKGTS
jgi:ABC-type polysaccharide/polyol phosphate transport system ATPase subunit